MKIKEIGPGGDPQHPFKSALHLHINYVTVCSVAEKEDMEKH